MNEQQFLDIFDELPPRRKTVLKQLLAGRTDEEIAAELNIAQTTVRKHVENLCQDFHLTDEFPDDRHSKRPELQALFRRYKPELVRDRVSETGRSGDDPFATVGDRDVFILIDRSGSMVRKDSDTRNLPRCQFLQEEVEAHTYGILSHRLQIGEVEKQICDRISIYFFCRDEVGTGPYKISDAAEVQNIFEQNPPRGNSFVTPTLKTCIETWLKEGQRRGRGAFFIIYTDGLFDDEAEFIDCISYACDRVVSEKQLKFFVLGLGEEIKVEYFLDLDFNINQQNPYNLLVFDLVNEVNDIIEVLQRQLVDDPTLAFPEWTHRRYPEFVQKVKNASQKNDRI